MGSGVDCFAWRSGAATGSACDRGGDAGRLGGDEAGRTVCDLEVRRVSRDTEPSRVEGIEVDALLSNAPRLERARLASFDGFLPDDDPPSNPH